MMLSSVGQRMYWMGRYVERAESSARLIRVYSELFLDLPRGAGIGWKAVLDISGADPLFRKAGGNPDDAQSIIRFLLTDEDNPGSLLNALSLARENARTTRDIIPTEAWRVLNELYLTATSQLPAAHEEQSRGQILADVIQRCQLLTGLMGATMSHGDGYQLMKLGWHLERADMTTRIIDVAAALLLTREEELARYSNSLWMAVLRSQSAYQMYRQYVRRRVTDRDVIQFLISDPLFPRSVAYCIGAVENAISALPRADTPARNCRAIREIQESVSLAELDPAGLHEYIDRLQLALAELHETAYATWFAPADAA